MDLKVLTLILVYYGILSLVVLFPGSPLLTTQHNNIPPINDTALAANENVDAGVFSTGVSFGRFVIFITTGTGLPDDTPSWVKIIIGVWQSSFTMFTIAWFIASIWNG